MKISILLLFFLSSLAHAKFELYFKNYRSTRLQHSRDIYVYKPKNYHRDQTYPLIVMHDGQNLFDSSRAFGGRTWNAEHTLDHLIKTEQMSPAIVVAIDNTPDRMEEYIWERQGERYVDFLIHELIPHIEQSYKLKKGAEFRALMGSSLGGLISLRSALHRPESFGLVAALSPSIWWNNKEILELFERSSQLPLKIYLDMGTREGERAQDLEMLAEILRNRAHTSFLAWIDQWGGHNEAAWAHRLPFALKYLFPFKK